LTLCGVNRYNSESNSDCTPSAAAKPSAARTEKKESLNSCLKLSMTDVLTGSATTIAPAAHPILAVRETRPGKTQGKNPVFDFASRDRVHFRQTGLKGRVLCSRP
jgi:hypothetical protein